ncbi:MAG: phosphoribosylanthranilate isomerase [Pseudomonadota bacterium]
MNPIIKRPWIKICGLTQVENAIECAKLEPDAIGLVFFEKSPRNISIEQAGHICSALPEAIQTIGVFVDESYDDIMAKVDSCDLKGVQLHGNEPPELIDRLLENKLIVIKALFAAKPPFLKQNALYTNASFLLVEYGKGVLPGGNAESWNYEISLQLKTTTPIILAGGLTPNNVKHAITSARPAGVDISSGVEKSPGIKDLGKVKAFIKAVKSY